MSLPPWLHCFASKPWNRRALKAPRSERHPCITLRPMVLYYVTMHYITCIGPFIVLHHSPLHHPIRSWQKASARLPCLGKGAARSSEEGAARVVAARPRSAAIELRGWGEAPGLPWPHLRLGYLNICTICMYICIHGNILTHTYTCNKVGPGREVSQAVNNTLIEKQRGGRGVHRAED